MKKIVKTTIFLLSSLALFTACDGNGRTEKSVKDDGTTMTITVNGNFNNKHIDFKKDYDISSMNKEEKQMLTKHVFDSLGVGK